MPTPPLTAAAVAKIRPGAKRRVVRDGGARSLYLVVQPSGHKSWLMRFRRPGGKPGKLVLGPLNCSGRELTDAPVVGMPLTLAAARQLAAAVHRERALGHDPVAAHKRRRTERKEAEADTYSALVRRFAEEHAKLKTRKWRYTLVQLGLRYPKEGGAPVETKGGLVQRWGARPVRTIDGHAIYSAVDEARSRGTPGIKARNGKLSEARARDLHTALSTMFGWLHRHRLVESNPAAGVWRPTTAPPRDRVLTADEIVRFWHACANITEPFGAVLRLLLLTGCRLNEIAAMCWDELRDGNLHLPATRTKNRHPHIVPLPPLARDIIAVVPRIEHCPFVFTTTGRTPISGWSKVKRQLDTAMGNPPPWIIHDLRRSFVTHLAELGIRPDLIEVIVNHVGGHRGGVAGIYNRSERMDERRAALARWATHVQGLVSRAPTNITPLRARP
jgi:integrase